MPDMPIESRFKYGTFEDVRDEDADDIASMLRGGGPVGKRDTRPTAELQGTDEVDEDFLRKAGNPSSHYGRG